MTVFILSLKERIILYPGRCPVSVIPRSVENHPPPPSGYVQQSDGPIASQWSPWLAAGQWPWCWCWCWPLVVAKLRLSRVGVQTRWAFWYRVWVSILSGQWTRGTLFYPVHHSALSTILLSAETALRFCPLFCSVPTLFIQLCCSGHYFALSNILAFPLFWSLQFTVLSTILLFKVISLHLSR